MKSRFFALAVLVALLSSHSPVAAAAQATDGEKVLAFMKSIEGSYENKLKGKMHSFDINGGSVKEANCSSIDLQSGTPDLGPHPEKANIVIGNSGLQQSMTVGVGYENVGELVSVRGNTLNVISRSTKTVTLGGDWASGGTDYKETDTQEIKIEKTPKGRLKSISIVSKMTRKKKLDVFFGTPITILENKVNCTL
ncbi:MAG: hypothetical protein AAB250_02000 [Bdellovibrionota bacterium]